MEPFQENSNGKTDNSLVIKSLEFLQNQLRVEKFAKKALEKESNQIDLAIIESSQRILALETKIRREVERLKIS